MSNLVVDSSVALKWILNEPHRTEALKLRADFQAGVHRLFAPDTFAMEAGHVLSKLHRTKKLTAKESEDALSEILTTCPELRDALLLFPRAFELTIQTRASLWDCFYLALSEETGAPFVTADEKLINNLGNPPNVIHLSKL